MHATKTRSEYPPEIEEFHRRIMQAAEPIAGDIELVIVNDGSPDDSLALALQRIDPRLVVIDMSRNFMHHKASGRTAATVARSAGRLAASATAALPACRAHHSRASGMSAVSLAVTACSF